VAQFLSGSTQTGIKAVRRMSVPGQRLGPLEWQSVEVLIAQAMAEDLGPDGDITSRAIIPDRASGAASLVARSPGVLAGLEIVERLAAVFKLNECWQPHQSDGDSLVPGSVIARLAGSMQTLLALERTALNFLQRLSGIATLTARFVAATAGTRAAIYDTRKTIPGWRALEKYAVRCGGGLNHRMGLFDAVLIKDNHLAWLEAAAGNDGLDPIPGAIAAARARTAPGTTIEIEVDSLKQLDSALGCSPDIILIDNFSHEQAAEAVRRRAARAPLVQLEASGGVNLSAALALARIGIDRISVGALTHSAPALDIALDFECGPEAARLVHETGNS
jgi:nicotinate-nucleotide pyrophosphorylase (carboxylating)